LVIGAMPEEAVVRPADSCRQVDLPSASCRGRATGPSRAGSAPAHPDTARAGPE